MEIRAEEITTSQEKQAWDSVSEMITDYFGSFDDVRQEREASGTNRKFDAD